MDPGDLDNVYGSYGLQNLNSSLKNFSQSVKVNLGANHTSCCSHTVVLFEDCMSCSHLSGPPLPNVEGNGEEKTVDVVWFVVEGNSALVPILVNCIVVKHSKVAELGDMS